MKYRQLGCTGQMLSILGMGGSGFGNVYGKYNEQEAIKAVHYSLHKGINFFDTAYWYGQGKSESFLGKALQGVPRDQFFIATKVGRYERDVLRQFDFSAGKVVQSAKESLQRLQMDYVDLLQVHDVEFAPSTDLIVNETLPALEELRNSGVCRFVGITGYSLPILLTVASKSSIKIDSILTYCRLTLNDSSLLEHFAEFRRLNIPLINASPVSMGLLTDAFIQDWHPATEEIKTACANAVEYCTQMGVDITRLAVNYSAGFQEVTSTLVSMNDYKTVNKNIEATLQPLTPKEKEAKEYIRKTFFLPLKKPHWEGVEVQQYWQKLE